MEKRAFDLIFSIILLSLFAPLFLICMVAVKLSSKGSVFYAHDRIGRQGRGFKCFKFRTMYENKDLEPILAANPSLQIEWNTYFKLKEDPRVTPVGKFLRKSSLDELPQMWNVLKGDMGVVGPRPLTQQEVDQYLLAKADKILSVRPGLTSLWIVRGRNRLSLEKRVELEEYYINNRSLWLDCKIIFQTALAMLFSKNAY